MIVVEGLDNTGKTTLVERIQQDFPQLKHHPSIGNKHDLDQIARQAYQTAYEGDPLDLWDRSRLISEYVYNPVLKGRPLAFNLDSFFDYLGQWLKTPHLVIYCRRPLVKIAQGFDEREQLSGVYEHLTDLYQAYDIVMRFIAYMMDVADTGGKLFTYDFEEDEYVDWVHPKIDDYLTGKGWTKN